MPTNVIRVVLAGVVIVVGAIGPARATGSASPTRVAGTATVIVPCRQYPDYGVLAPLYNEVHPACPNGTKPVALTIAAAHPRHAYVSVCDPGRSWCADGLGEGLWPTSPRRLHCSAVVGRTWYGLMWVGSDRHSGRWWTFKVVDGGLEGGDRFGVRVTDRTGSGPCGAGDVKVTPVLAGDFGFVTAPGPGSGQATGSLTRRAGGALPRR